MTEDTGGGTDHAPGYTLTPPDGWSRIPVRDPRAAGETIGTMLAELTAGLAGPEVAAARTEAAEQFADRLAAAARIRGVELLIPPIRPGRPTPGEAILVAEVTVPEPAADDPEAVVDQVVATKPWIRRGTIDGAPGIRADNADETAHSGVDITEGVRRVEYTFAVPDDPHHRWLSFALTAGTGGVTADVVTAQVQQFDTAMATLSWTNTRHD
jgi:hypothetical protein